MKVKKLKKKEQPCENRKKVNSIFFLIKGPVHTYVELNIFCCRTTKLAKL